MITPAEHAALIAYLTEQRRHLLAQVKAVEVLLAVLQDPKPKVDINQ